MLTEQDVHEDERGWSCQPFSLLHHNWWQNRGDITHTYSAFSKEGVVRGFHWQNPNPQTKFVHCVFGLCCAATLDIRIGSPTFGQFEEFFLDCRRTLYLPHGFALAYKCVTPVVLYYMIHGDYHPSSARRCHVQSVDFVKPMALATASDIHYGIMSDDDSDAPMLDDVPKEWLFNYETCDSR